MAEQPLYQQIAEDLRKQIDDGTLAPGSQLPTEVELRERTMRRGTPSGTPSRG